MLLYSFFVNGLFLAEIVNIIVTGNQRITSRIPNLGVYTINNTTAYRRAIR